MQSVDQFQDLLIFEESLRREYKSLLRKRRINLSFLSLLLAWIAFFFHGVWLDPSPYYYISFFYRISLLGGITTLGLFYASGLYTDGIVASRKFIPHTNRALKYYNVKLVPNRSPGIFNKIKATFKRQEFGEGGIKLVLTSKVADNHMREAWEIYRREYWAQRALTGIVDDQRPSKKSTSTKHHEHKHDESVEKGADLVKKGKSLAKKTNRKNVSTITSGYDVP